MQFLKPFNFLRTFFQLSYFTIWFKKLKKVTKEEMWMFYGVRQRIFISLCSDMGKIWNDKGPHIRSIWHKILDWRYSKKTEVLLQIKIDLCSLWRWSHFMFYHIALFGEHLSFPFTRIHPLARKNSTFSTEILILGQFQRTKQGNIGPVIKEQHFYPLTFTHFLFHVLLILITYLH